MSDLKAGKLEPYVKSEPIPDKNDGPIKIAVANNFNELVINSGKDTFVEFYAPWCTHCKALEPVMDELATKMLGEDIDIVKFDATANDIPPGFELKGYPTFFWMAKEAKMPHTYGSSHKLKTFLKFISRHATNELKSLDRSGEVKKTEL